MSQSIQNKRATASMPPKGCTEVAFTVPKKGSKFSAASSVMATSTDWVQPSRNQKASPKRVAKNKLTSSIVADLIIDFCNEHGDLITNLKLQRLLYFAQCWYLAIYDSPLFPEDFEARINGPIQKDVYDRFFVFRHRPIDQVSQKWNVAKRISDHVSEIMDTYGDMSSFELERIACNETPWNLARESCQDHLDQSCHIEKEAMKEFYRARLNEQEK